MDEEGLKMLFSDEYNEKLKRFLTWDALLRTESQIGNLEGTKGVDISHVTEEDDSLSWKQISIVIKVKRKCRAEEFNEWYYGVKNESSK